MENQVKQIKENQNKQEGLKILVMVLGLILMLIGSILMFSRTYVVFEETLYLDYFDTPTVQVFKSTAFGLLGLGFTTFLFGKELLDRK